MADRQMSDARVVNRRSRFRVLAYGLCLGLALSSSLRALAGQAPQEKQGAPDKLPGRIFVNATANDAPSVVMAVDPNDQTWSQVSGNRVAPGRVSPDGRSIVQMGLPRGPEKLRPVDVFDITGERPTVTIFDLKLGIIADTPFWSADGKFVYVSHRATMADSPGFETWRVDADGSHRTKLPIAGGPAVHDISPDGEWLVTVAYRPGEAERSSRPSGAAFLVHPDGTGERRLIDPNVGSKGPLSTRSYRFSPDGRTIAYIVQPLDAETGRQTSGRLCLVSIDGKNARCIREGTTERFPIAACWSPDGKCLAVAMWQKPADAGPGPVSILRGTTTVEVIDREGRTRETLHLPPTQYLVLVDWR